MENIKKAIVFDMDETLEHGECINDNEMVMTLRPNIDSLIKKLEEVKKDNIDVILCTTATNKWVDRFLELKPEFKNIFDKLLTRDNKDIWSYSSIDASKYPEEAKALREDYGNFEYGKPITTFGYNQVLFIEDNMREEERVKDLFEYSEGKLDKDVTFLLTPHFHPTDLMEVFNYVMQSKNIETIENLKKYFEVVNKDNGITCMIEEIENFRNKEYQKGLTIADNKYEKQNKEYYEEEKKALRQYANRFRVLDYLSEDELFSKYNEYIKKDKHYPFEDIDFILNDLEKNLVKSKEDIGNDLKKLDVSLSDINKIKQNIKEKPNESREL